MEPEGPAIEEVREIPDYHEDQRPTRFWATEVMRAVLALIFAVFLGIVIVWGFLNAGGRQETWTATKELLQLLLPAITALLGSAVGFYFGTQKIQ